MFKAIPIPESLVGKIKRREWSRNEFIDVLLAMEAETMIEVPDTQYKYASVRGRVSDANRRLRETKSGKRLITTRQNGSTATLVMCHAV
jgi:hypothetical protein